MGRVSVEYIYAIMLMGISFAYARGLGLVYSDTDGLVYVLAPIEFDFLNNFTIFLLKNLEIRFFIEDLCTKK